MSTSVTKRDLGSFADQLNTVGRQLSDPVISRKMDTLVNMLHRISEKNVALDCIYVTVKVRNPVNVEIHR